MIEPEAWISCSWLIWSRISCLTWLTFRTCRRTKSTQNIRIRSHPHHQLLTLLERLDFLLELFLRLFLLDLPDLDEVSRFFLPLLDWERLLLALLDWSPRLEAAALLAFFLDLSAGAGRTGSRFFPHPTLTIAPRTTGTASARPH